MEFDISHCPTEFLFCSVCLREQNVELWLWYYYYRFQNIFAHPLTPSWSALFPQVSLPSSPLLRSRILTYSASSTALEFTPPFFLFFLKNSIYSFDLTNEVWRSQFTSPSHARIMIYFGFYDSPNDSLVSFLREIEITLKSLGTHYPHVPSIKMLTDPVMQVERCTILYIRSFLR